jgi:hypothetical protein
MQDMVIQTQGYMPRAEEVRVEQVSADQVHLMEAQPPVLAEQVYLLRFQGQDNFMQMAEQVPQIQRTSLILQLILVEVALAQTTQIYLLHATAVRVSLLFVIR